MKYISKIEENKEVFKSIARGTISLLDYDTLMIQDNDYALECGINLNKFLDEAKLEDTQVTDSIFEDLNAFTNASVLTYKDLHNLCRRLYKNYETLLGGLN